MQEAQHNANNAFVKRSQDMLKSMGMKKDVNLAPHYQNMDACMINNGEHAQEFARTLTKGIDEKAFPVK